MYMNACVQARSECDEQEKENKRSVHGVEGRKRRKIDHSSLFFPLKKMLLIKPSIFLIENTHCMVSIGLQVLIVCSL